MFMTFFTPIKSQTVSQITVAVSAGASGFTSGSVQRLGLYSYDETTATLLARTADNTAIFAAGSNTQSFDTTGGYPTTVTLEAGKRYGVAIICNATTMPTLVGPPSFAGSGQAFRAQNPRMNGVVTVAAGTDIPTSTTVSNASTYIWSRLS
jgi:hypothetical protein